MYAIRSYYDEGDISVANTYARRMFPELNDISRPLELTCILPQLDMRRVLQKGEKILAELRITSYNVCYTKLLR